MEIIQDDLCHNITPQISLFLSCVYQVEYLVMMLCFFKPAFAIPSVKYRILLRIAKYDPTCENAWDLSKKMGV